MTLPVTLTINGTAVDMTADGTDCEVLTLERGFAAPDRLTLRRSIAHDNENTWRDEDDVILATDDGTTRFRGKVKANDRSASVGGESIMYTCLGLRDQANRYTFRRSVSGATVSRVVYNCPKAEEDSEAGHVAIAGRTSSVGDIVKDIIDTMASTLSGVVGTGTGASCYTLADLGAMTSIPGKVVIDALHVDDAIAYVLQHQPDFGHYIDPETQRYVFVDLTTLTAKSVAGVNGSLIEQSLNYTTGPCYTACTIEGGRELHDVYDDGLTEDWDTDLEADWDIEKMLSHPDTYGRVWRYFTATKAVAAGGVVMPERIVGDGQIVSIVTVKYWDPTTEAYLGQNGYPATAARADDTHILLNFIARQAKSTDLDQDGTAYTTEYETCGVRAWYTYGKAPISGRYPVAGGTYEGTAWTRHGLARERWLTQEERRKALIDATVEEVVAGNQFRIFYPAGSVLEENELAGLEMYVNDSTADRYTIESNTFGGALITVDRDFSPALQADDEVHVVVQDDTELVREGDTMSILQQYAMEYVKRFGDEQYGGTVPLTELDWTFALGQKINFTGTDNPEYDSLGAALVEVSWDIGNGRTNITLTNERAGPEASWGEIEARRQLAREAEENKTQIRRLWDKVRKAERDKGPTRPSNSPDDEGGLSVNERSWVESGDAWISVAAVPRGDQTLFKVLHAAGDGVAKGWYLAGAGTRFDQLVIDNWRHLIQSSTTATVDAVVSGDNWIGCSTVGGTVTVVHNDPQAYVDQIDTRNTPVLWFDGKGHFIEANAGTALAALSIPNDWWNRVEPGGVPAGPIEDFVIIT